MNILQRAKAAWKILAGYHLQEYSRDRRYSQNTSNQTRDDIKSGTRERMLWWAREFERRDPIFNAFLDRCEQYVVGPTGLRIVSDSTDSAFADDATAEFNDWQPWCDVSTRQSFGQVQGLMEREAEVAGGLFIHKTFGSSLRPRIQLIEPESIVTPPYLASEKTVVDGIREDPITHRPLEYFIRPADPSQRPWPSIQASQMIHAFERSRINQARELTILYPVLKDLLDLTELQDLEMVSAKDNAETAKWITNEAGEVPSTEDLVRSVGSKSTQTPAGVTTTGTREDYYKEAIGGKTWVLKRGDTLNAHQSNRPGPAVQAFWEYVSARAAAGMGLPIEIMIMRSLQGTMTRAALDMAAAFFRCRAAARAEAFAQVWEHVIDNTAKLRRNRPIDWRKIRYTCPRAINVDVGYNSAAVIAEWKEGFKSLEDIVGPFGKSPEEVLRARARDWKLARDIEKQEQVPAGTLLSFDERAAKQEQEMAEQQQPSGNGNGNGTAARWQFKETT